MNGHRQRRRDALTSVRRIIVAAAAMTAVASRALATEATPPDRDLRDLSLEELMEVRVATVVGASKHTQKVTDAPSAVTVVTHDEIRKFGHRTLADVLRSVRGFYTSYDRTYGYIGVRGFNNPGDFGGRVLLTIDGHRLNEPLFDSAFNATDFLLDVDLIDRVEIIRGPGSVLYGNNAFFAVVNVITLRGTQIDGVELATSAGSYDTYQGRATVGKGFANGLEVLLSATGYGSHGKGHIAVPGLGPTPDQPGYAKNIDADEFWSTFGSLRYRGFTLEGGYIRRQKDAPLAPYGTVFNDDRQHPIDSRGYANLRWAGTVGDAWETQARAYYDYYGLEIDYPFDASEPDGPSLVAINRERDRAQWLGVEAQTSRKLFGKHRLTVGMEARYDFELKIRSWDDPPFELVSNLDTTAHRESVFLETEIALLSKLTLVAGGRFDHYSEFGDTVNPRTALVYRPSERASVKFLYGHAYRAPNAFERDFSGLDSRPNPDLDPERIRTYELVYEHYLPHDLRVSASGFLNQTQDLIGQTTDDDDFLVYENLDGAETKGLELEAEYKNAGGWLARASYTLQRTEYDGGDEVPNSPRHLVKANAIAPLWPEKVFAGAELQYSSSVRTVPGRETRRADDYTLVNLTLTARDLVKGLEVQGSVYNLFDEHYAFPAGDELVPDVMAQDGRTFRVKVVYRF